MNDMTIQSNIWRSMLTAPKGECGSREHIRVLLVTWDYRGADRVVIGYFDWDIYAANPKPFWRYEGGDMSYARRNPPVAWMPIPPVGEIVV